MQILNRYQKRCVTQEKFVKIFSKYQLYCQMNNYLYIKIDNPLKRVTVYLSLVRLLVAQKIESHIFPSILSQYIFKSTIRSHQRRIYFISQLYKNFRYKFYASLRRFSQIIIKT